MATLTSIVIEDSSTDIDSYMLLACKLAVYFDISINTYTDSMLI